VLARPRPATTATGKQLLAVVEQLGAVQLDAVNVLERTQYVVMWSRVGNYDRAVFDALAQPMGSLFEGQTRGVAAFMPVALQPLYRRDEAQRLAESGSYAPTMRAIVEQNADYTASILEEVRRRGALTASKLEDPQRGEGLGWERGSKGRAMLGWLTSIGHLVGYRSPSFESVYDLPERVLRPEVLAAPTPSVHEARRERVRVAAKASGIVTLRDLSRLTRAGHLRLAQAELKTYVAELVEEGNLVAARVEGWKDPAFVVAGRRPKRATRTEATLLSPFDPLIWDRDRTRRIFGFDYIIEIYVPAPKRVHGYYVLPILIGDDLVGRLDLKSDRARSTLLVQGAWAEPTVDKPSVAEATAAELRRLAAWLGLQDIDVAKRGDLARQLKSTLSGGEGPDTSL
jgi:uncharacterized protein YcaQ